MTTRRASARLSGESSTTTLVAPIYAAPAPTHTRKRRSGEIAKEKEGPVIDEIDSSRKKQKVETINMKPATRGRKPAFQPAPLPTPSTSNQPSADDTFQPPPPPRTPKPARHRPSLRGKPEPDQEEEEEEDDAENERTIIARRPPPRTAGRGGVAATTIAATTTTTTARGGKKAPVANGRAVVGAGNGKPSQSRGHAGAEDGDVGGLDAGTSLDAELGNEIGRWQPRSALGGNKDMIDNDLDRHLDFLNTSQPAAKPIFTAPRPRTPPPTLGLLAPHTPGVQSKRILPRKSFAGSHNAALGTPGRGGDTSKDVMVPLAIVDTPLVSKERQSMRRDAGRRSSTGRGGQRMSESLTRGEVCMPHASVPSDSLWRYLNPSLPEPKRAQHLNLWTLNRADLRPATELPPVVDANTLEALNKKSSAAQSKAKAKGKGKEVGPSVSETTAGLARKVMERLMDDVKMARIPMNTYPPPGIIPDFGGLRPHPRNVANRQSEAEMNALINKDKIESALWSQEIAIANKRIEDFRTSMRDRNTDEWTENDSIPNLDEDKSVRETRGLLDGRAIENARAWSALASEVLAEVDDGSLERDDGDAEYKVDLLAQACHQTMQFSNQASRFLDGIFSSLAQDLRNRHHLDGPASTIPSLGGDPGDPANQNADAVSLMAAVQRATTTSTSNNAPVASTSGPTGRTDPIEMLRSLARAEASTQSQEVLAAAASLPPVIPSGASGSGHGAALAPPPPTPRRGLSGGLTPRRQGPLGGSTPKR